ncbi:YciI family protein [Pseudoduganella sp. DS3]|uniref:YciI family protein n=2 Tax=Pseudoduganella guangdongensis TaxID=2692179 RepID=A0A6N9HGP5_9BURK|nr:YciI family protein [Pseudoduganella guangdongensis]
MQFMLLIYAEEKVYDALPPAQLAEVMAAYGALENAMLKAGVLVAGAELAPVRKARTVRIRRGQPHFTDGPFAETKEALGGYFLIDCASMDDALEWAARCPTALDGCVEVRPLASPPAA